jgi:hypothetical protein
MQRKIPSCCCCQKGPKDGRDFYSRSNSTMLGQCQHAVSRKCRVGSGLLTWIPCSTIGAPVVARYLQQIVQHALIASLLPLTDCTRHVVLGAHVREWKGAVEKMLSYERGYMRCDGYYGGSG